MQLTTWYNSDGEKQSSWPRQSGLYRVSIGKSLGENFLMVQNSMLSYYCAKRKCPTTADDLGGTRRPRLIRLDGGKVLASNRRRAGRHAGMSSPRIRNGRGAFTWARNRHSIRRTMAAGNGLVAVATALRGFTSI